MSRPFKPSRITRRRVMSGINWILAGFAFVIVAVPLLDILYTVLAKGFSALSFKLFTEVTNGISGGLLNAITGTLVLVAGALLIAVPVGVLAGIHLSEFGRGRFGRLVRFLDDVLTGVPSIVLGYFSYVTLVIGMGWQFSMLAGSITLAIMVVPYIARFTEIAFSQVPNNLREAGYALGLREFTVITRIALPLALPGILTGALLAMAISLGETAPLIYTAGWSNFLWSGRLIHEPIGYLTYVIWSFINQPYRSAHALAFAAAFLVILLVLLTNVAATSLLRRTHPIRPGR
ncbi:MAG: phosphate ABC transporter permease PstA [Gammaproteobacteria bacterium]|nr:phosphate ABC transporter permease PstA [Gammaproteobacteria bacterium]